MERSRLLAHLIAVLVLALASPAEAGDSEEAAGSTVANAKFDVVVEAPSEEWEVTDSDGRAIASFVHTRSQSEVEVLASQLSAGGVEDVFFESFHEELRKKQFKQQSRDSVTMGGVAGTRTDYEYTQSGVTLGVTTFEFARNGVAWVVVGYFHRGRGVSPSVIGEIVGNIEFGADVDDESTAEADSSAESSERRAQTAGPLQVEFHVAGQHAYHPSFDAFGSGDTPNVFGSPTLGVAWRLDEWLPFDGLAIYGAHSRVGLQQWRFQGDYGFNWRRQLYLIGGEYGLRLSPALRPFVRATVGLAHQRVGVTPLNRPEFSGESTNFASRHSVGVELHTPFGQIDGDDGPPMALSENITLGVTAQAGYLAQTPANFDGLEPGSGTYEEESPWRRSGFDLGELRTHGWFWALGAQLRARL